MLRTWQTGDVSLQEPYNGDFEMAMASIKAKTLVLPSKTDLYFPPEDSEYEVKCMSPGVGKLDVFPSVSENPPFHRMDIWCRLVCMTDEMPDLGPLGWWTARQHGGCEVVGRTACEDLC